MFPLWMKVESKSGFREVLMLIYCNGWEMSAPFTAIHRVHSQLKTTSAISWFLRKHCLATPTPSRPRVDIFVCLPQIRSIEKGVCGLPRFLFIYPIRVQKKMRFMEWRLSVFVVGCMCTALQLKRVDRFQ